MLFEYEYTIEGERTGSRSDIGEVFGRNCSEIVTKRASISLLFSFLFSSDCYRGRGGGEEIVVPRRITQLGMLLGQNGVL